MKIIYQIDVFLQCLCAGAENHFQRWYGQNNVVVDQSKLTWLINVMIKGLTMDEGIPGLEANQLFAFSSISNRNVDAASVC